MVTKETKNIRVSVIAQYQHERSNPDMKNYLHAYRVRIENLSDHPVQLISRFWRIKNSLGKTKVVEGPGVIGEQPIILPGDSHSYSSWSPLNTPIGTMDGYYIMLSKRDNVEFKVAIPQFRLDATFVNN